MGKVYNVQTKRQINLNGVAFNKLVKQGYIYDANTNTISPPGRSDDMISDIQPNVATSIKPIKNIEYVKPIFNTLTPNDLVIQDKLGSGHFNKVIHLSDIHIPMNLHSKRYDEYTTVFNRLYSEIKDKHFNNSIIVITGDLMHTKLKMEPETILLARQFLQSLSDIAPTIIAIGNHDFAQNNLERLDSLTAICDGIPVHLLKHTGIYKFSNILFVFNSLFDCKFITRDMIDTKLPVYALYHGTLVGSLNDNGTINKESKTKTYPSIQDFAGFDAVLLGHIHKQQFIKPHIAYAGSLIQQNFGETIDHHGYLVWNTITHTASSHDIPNDYIRLNVNVNAGIIDTPLNKYKNNKLLLKCSISNTNLEQLKIFQETIASQPNICETTFSKPIKHDGLLDNTNINNELSIDDEIQLIKDKCNKPSILDQVIKLHQDFYKSINHNCSIWYPTKLQFKNIGIFGKDNINTVNFVNGISNICAPNGTGKSTIVNVFFCALFGKSSLSNTGGLDIINKYSKTAFIKLSFVHNNNNNHYSINRHIELKTRNTRINACTTTTKSLDFNRIQSDGSLTLLNGTSVSETQNIINQYTGSFNHFIVNNIISTRHDIIPMLAQKPSELFKHIHNICNTSHYDTYIDKSKKISAPLKKQLLKIIAINEDIAKQINSINIDKTKSDIITHQTKLFDIKVILDDLINQKNNINMQISNINQSINNVQDFNPQTDYQSQLNNFKPDLIKEASNHTLSSINSLINDIPHINHYINHEQVITENTQILNGHEKPKLSNTELIQQSSTLKQQISNLQDKINNLNTQSSISTNESESILIQSIKHLNTSNYNIQDIDQIKIKFENIHINPDIAVNTDNIQQLQKNLQEFNKPTDSSHILNAIDTLKQQYMELNDSELSLTDDISDPDIIHPIIINEYSIKDITSLQNQIKSIKVHESFDANIDIDSLKQQLVKLQISFDSIRETNITTKTKTQLLSLLIHSDNHHYVLSHDIIQLQINKQNLMKQYNHIWYKQFLDNDQSNYIIPVPIFNQEYNDSNHIKLSQLNQLYNSNFNTHILRLKQIHINKHNSFIQSQINFIDKQNISNQISSIKNTIKQSIHFNHKTQLIHTLDKLIQNKYLLIKNIQQRYNIFLNKYQTIKNNIKDKQILIQTINNTNLFIQKQDLSNILNNLIHIKLVHQKLHYIYIKQIQDKQIALDQCSNSLKWYQIQHIIKQSQDQIHLIHKINHLQTIKDIIIINNLILFKQLDTLQNKLHNINPLINLHNSDVARINKLINTLSTSITQHSNLIERQNKQNTTISDLQTKLDIHTEYQQLFNKNNIPALILLNRLKLFVNNTNQIFSNNTKYILQFTLSDKSLSFYVSDKHTNATLDTSRLCGFETVILDIALNRAALDISAHNKPSIFIVDERLDCIDQTQFNMVVSKLSTILKDNFHVNIIISHRDIPEQIVDSKIKISNYSQCSYIE